LKFEKNDQVSQKIKDDNDGLKARIRLVENENSEIKMEKQYLDSQLRFYKEQIEENKKLQDTLLNALKNQMKNEDDSDMIEKNKQLQSELGTADGRVKLMQDKLYRYKQFKKMIKFSSNLQCINCSAMVNPTSFLQHMSLCSRSSHSNRIYLGNNWDNSMTQPALSHNKTHASIPSGNSFVHDGRTDAGLLNYFDERATEGRHGGGGGLDFSRNGINGGGGQEGNPNNSSMQSSKSSASN
jgi:hypothetical protein